MVTYAGGHQHLIHTAHTVRSPSAAIRKQLFYQRAVRIFHPQQDLTPPARHKGHSPSIVHTPSRQTELQNCIQSEGSHVTVLTLVDEHVSVIGDVYVCCADGQFGSLEGLLH